eukprot:9423942-Heterocapsa_arctica.AAC.1
MANPCTPSRIEVDEHMATRIPFRAWCPQLRYRGRLRHAAFHEGCLGGGDERTFYSGRRWVPHQQEGDPRRIGEQRAHNDFDHEIEAAERR